MDTNVFSELAKAKPDAKAVQWLRDQESDLYISTVSVGEIRRGIEALAAGKRKTSLQAWLTDLCNRMEGRILSYNNSVAHVWGQMLARCDKRGISLPSMDSLIAATALRHNLTMVTRNVSDFQHTGLKVVNPFSTKG